MAPGLPDAVIPVPQRLGSRGLSFRVVVQSPMEHDVELVATGLVGHHGQSVPLTGSLHHMDEALAGALSSWRENGGEPAPGDVKVFTPAYSGHRDHRDRRIVITQIGHRDRSEATLAGSLG
jgi:hypothetical protein